MTKNNPYDNVYQKAVQMSPLEQQFRELQIKKFKVRYFQTVLTLLETPGSKEENPESAEAELQAGAELTEFLNARIQSIENGKDSASTSTDAFLTLEEIDVLKQIAARAMDRTESLKTVPGNSAPPAKAPPRGPTQDKIRFALQNKNLDQKRVSFMLQGDEVGGVVVGLDAPNVIVKTDSGHTVPVPLNQITLE